MKTIPIRFLAVLLIISSALLRAGDEAGTRLAELAASKRAAVIRLDVLPAPNVWSYGVFISNDGLALIHIEAISKKKKPKVWGIGDTELAFGKILGVFPEQELALMKFDHRPKVWVDLAKAEPELGETIALLTLKYESPWKNKTPPVIGPVMAKRSETTANLREKRFVRILSLGSGMSTAQRTEIGPGCFAINAEGLLVAFTAGTVKQQRQTIISVAPVVSLVKEVEELAKGGVDLGFPLPEERNIIDHAAIDPDFHPMNIATIMDNHEESEKLLKGLRERHPDSHALRMRFYRQQGREGGAGGLLLDFPAPGPGEPAAHQVDYWSLRADILAQRQELDESIKARTKAVELSPKDYCDDRLRLAHLYAYLGRNEEAEGLYRECFEVNSDSIEFVEILESHWLKRGNLRESEKMTERVHELEKIYRR